MAELNCESWVMRSVTIMCHILCSHRANKRLQTALKTQTCIVFDIFCRISFKTLMKRNLPILGARIFSWEGIEILEIHYSLFTIHTHTLGFGIHSNSHSKKYCAYTYLMLGFKLWILTLREHKSYQFKLRWYGISIIQF